MFVNDLDDKAKRTLSKFPDNAKLRGMADAPKCHAAIQMDYNRLEKQADKDLIQFNQKTKQSPEPGQQ